MNEVRSLRERRRLVIIFYSGLAVPAVSLLSRSFAPVDIHPRLVLLGAFVVIGGPVTSAFMFAALWSSVKGLKSTKRRSLDERQLTIRNRAYYNAYWKLFAVFLAFGVFAIFIPNHLMESNLSRITITQADDLLDLLETLFCIVFVVAISLPTMTIVYNEPDPEPDVRNPVGSGRGAA